jgi:D-threo-aldose 1-dehydrogenase
MRLRTRSLLPGVVAVGRVRRTALPLRAPAIASLLVGAHSAAQVHDAAAQVDRAIPDGMWEALRSEGLLPPHLPVPEGT